MHLLHTLRHPTCQLELTRSCSNSILPQRENLNLMHTTPFSVTLDNDRSMCNLTGFADSEKMESYDRILRPTSVARSQVNSITLLTVSPRGSFYSTSLY